MLVENQLIEMKWHSSNRKHYEDLGYAFTNYGDLFYVKPLELTKGSTKKIEVICDYCGAYIKVSAYNYFNHHDKTDKDACNHCKTKKKSETTLVERQNSLYSRCLDVCKEEGYELISTKEDIIGNISKILYACPKHGVHEMRIGNLLSGKRCPDCAVDNNRKKYQMTKEDVVAGIEKCGGKILNAEEYINNQKKNLRILCPDCGKEFTTSYRSFVQHGGQLCKECSSVAESLGERKIRLYLCGHNIEFQQEYWFQDCRDINPLPFDFYLTELNTVVEFDGSQHYYPNTNHFTRAETTQRHDKIKNKYCEEHGIKMIRIPYWKFDKIDEILSERIINPHKDIV